MASCKADWSFPIGKACSHPAFCVQRRTRNAQLLCGDRDVPTGRDITPGNFRHSFWRHDDLGRGDLPVIAFRREPLAGNKMATVGPAQPKQHELLTLAEMQG